MDLRVVKLVTGEEVVGDVKAEDSDTLTLGTTFMVAVRGQQQNGGISWGFLPWGIFIDGNKVINKSQAVYIGLPSHDVSDAFRQATTGLAVPSNQILTG